MYLLEYCQQETVLISHVVAMRPDCQQLVKQFMGTNLLQILVGKVQINV